MNSLGVRRKDFGDHIDTTKISRVRGSWFRGEGVSIEVQLLLDGQWMTLEPKNKNAPFPAIKVQWDLIETNIDNLSTYDWTFWTEKR